jgi:DNA (cytosine-5)-methyltransferase 1
MERVRSWPTPTVYGNYNRKGLSPTSGDGLATAVQKWPTPTAHNAKETNAPSEANRNTPTRASACGGALNPTWVEWLMGWPIGWTDCDALATDRFREWLHSHGR